MSKYQTIQCNPDLIKPDYGNMIIGDFGKEVAQEPGYMSTYDKRMATRARNKQIKAAAAKTAAESVIYMMTESGQMVPIK